MLTSRMAMIKMYLVHIANHPWFHALRHVSRRVGLVFAVTFLFITLFFGFFYRNVFAKEDRTTEYYKYYTSIEIQSGDTLWSIACEYADENFTTVPDYIDELKFMNHMSSDQITEGHYLTVAYYSDIYQE